RGAAPVDGAGDAADGAGLICVCAEALATVARSLRATARLTRLPADIAWTMIVTLAVAPTPIAPRLAVTVLFAPRPIVPWVVTRSITRTFAGSVSASTTPVSASGPVLPTVSVYVKLPPAVAESGAVLASVRLAVGAGGTGLTCVGRLALAALLPSGPAR